MHACSHACMHAGTAHACTLYLERHRRDRLLAGYSLPFLQAGMGSSQTFPPTPLHVRQRAGEASAQPLAFFIAVHLASKERLLCVCMCKVKDLSVPCNYACVLLALHVEFFLTNLMHVLSFANPPREHESHAGSPAATAAASDRGQPNVVICSCVCHFVWLEMSRRCTGRGARISHCQVSNLLVRGLLPQSLELASLQT